MLCAARHHGRPSGCLLRLPTCARLQGRAPMPHGGACCSLSTDAAVKEDTIKSIEGEQRLHLGMVARQNIRNFGIIAHVDHGKSTLADRLMELTGCMPSRSGDGKAASPLLDSLQVERERGITVKAQCVSMFHREPPSQPWHMLNLIDTPGHADFTNEVERSMAAIQGALLVVDAVAGVQAQTAAHYWRARSHGLKVIIPVINKIDLPSANVDRAIEQLEEQLHMDVFNLPILTISAKSGLNVPSILNAVIKYLPPPPLPLAAEDGSQERLQATLIDCWFKEYLGAIFLVSVQSGTIRCGDEIASRRGRITYTVEEVGILQPGLVRTGLLSAGHIGYIRCNARNAAEIIIGDTFQTRLPAGSAAQASADGAGEGAVRSLLNRVRPLVFASFFPANREDHEVVREAIEKLLLNDASVSLEKISSPALGCGWRMGFLGSLHMDVFQQRLQQEYSVDVIVTAPSVTYQVYYKDPTKAMESITSPEDFPTDPLKVSHFTEPIVDGTICLPAAIMGAVSELCSECRARDVTIEYLGVDRIKLRAKMPLVEIIGSFNDRLMAISAGYATFDYALCEDGSGSGETARVDLVKIGIRVNGDPVDVLASIQPREKAVTVGRRWTAKLAEILPRQQFVIAIQAVIGNKVVARENISALRKDVTAKCYGGDKTRKMKLLEKQKAGKERMRMLGRVEIPSDAFARIMRVAS